MNEIHLPKHQDTQHLGLYKIHCAKVEIYRTYLWHTISKSQSLDMFLPRYYIHNIV